MKYHIETFGCQMNTADSQRLASELEKLGLSVAEADDVADVMVVNTCVVRQQAEDRAIGWAYRASQLKQNNPNLVIGMMGCLVGVKGNKKIAKLFPNVDVFMSPSDPQPMVDYLLENALQRREADETLARHHLQDNLELHQPLLLPTHERGNLIAAHVPIVYGCSHACTFCIIPFRRGIERSRPVGEIAAEVRSLVAQGVREVTLLGQIVDRYGYDVPDGPNLEQLLRVLHEIDGLQRIRFLTSHPNYMTDALLQTVAELPKVMEHIEVPVQAGDDDVLDAMKRGYTTSEYRQLVARIRATIPNVAIHCDIIVGFPGETEAQFQKTYDLLADLKLDKVHLARYSEREGTVASRRMNDDVSEAEKKRRLLAIEDMQREVQREINARFLGQEVEILVEGKVKDLWSGRTRNNKLVHFDSAENLLGQVVRVKIVHTSPYSMKGQYGDDPATPDVPEVIELPVLGG
ncbi:MAG TPA: tRNA (N6-isopentenyl adenosine(37)-C2)-methylthiotransferase MiaB [Anaerolineales bacterium]|nr:tRNA (N6-isopentenyl adenosine(37)-C2)-methylthiotransferase MiaB [Anaerolineales bacterium]